MHDVRPMGLGDEQTHANDRYDAFCRRQSRPAHHANGNIQNAHARECRNGEVGNEHQHAYEGSGNAAQEVPP